MIPRPPARSPGACVACHQRHELHGDATCLCCACHDELVCRGCDAVVACPAELHLYGEGQLAQQQCAECCADAEATYAEHHDDGEDDTRSCECSVCERVRSQIARERREQDLALAARERESMSAEECPW